MRQTTGYDDMVIPRVKGKRREVRQMLAQRSKELLARYRREKISGDVHCDVHCSPSALIMNRPIFDGSTCDLSYSKTDWNVEITECLTN